MTRFAATLPLIYKPLGEIVRDDARTAAVLARYGLDFCCGGQQTLAEAAERRQAPIAAVVEALEALGAPGPDARAQSRWPELDTLTAHIVQQHHHYVREISPTIQAWLDRLVTRHGERHPELARIRETFGRLVEGLAAHMIKEEHVLFPYIDELAAAGRAGARLPSGPFGTVANPVRAMEADHRLASSLLADLRLLTSGYEPPEDACATYRFCFGELERFEADLKTHVHLENHVLFPEAVALEERLV